MPSPSWRDSENLPSEFADGSAGIGVVTMLGFCGDGRTGGAGGASTGMTAAAIDSGAGASAGGRGMASTVFALVWLDAAATDLKSMTSRYGLYSVKTL